MSNSNTAIHSNAMVTTIATLASMLNEQTANYQDAIKGLDEAERSSSGLREEVYQLQDDLECARRNSSAHEDRIHVLRGQAELFKLFVERSKPMNDALTFLRETLPEQRSQKISLIKTVREIAHIGLKEAKDFVETFLETNPVMVASHKDPNPCVDSYCLNHE